MNRLLFVIFIAFFASLLLYPLVIPLLRKVKAGQNILSYVEMHAQKQGTPTMGGVVFVPIAAVAAICFSQERPVLVACVSALAFLFVGFLDDFFKIRGGKNQGLRAWQKMLFLLAVGAAASVYAYRFGFTEVYVPFTYLSFDLGAWFIPFGIFVYAATVNCVNLTDGADGLAAACSLVYLAFLGIILMIQAEMASLSVVAFAFVGALAAFLLFNTGKASVFMGDTGSLALGGVIATLSLVSGNAFYIVILGIPFLLSGISVILQVAVFKLTHKRIFRMSPLHHHFQMKGYSEQKIVYAYSLLSVGMGLVAVCSLIV